MSLFNITTLVLMDTLESKMAVKKTMVPLIEYLTENLDKKVSEVIEAVVALASTKSRGTGNGAATTTMIKDANGKVVAILDYYFKRWMPLVGDLTVEFGKKASTASGFSSMCKLGTSLWTKQQQNAKKAMTGILLEVEDGSLAISDIAERKAEIEDARKAIAETELGFATEEECREYLAEIVDMTSTEA